MPLIVDTYVRDSAHKPLRPIVCICCDVIIEHLLNRLVKQELSSTIVTLATTFFRINKK
jgi:hypothetical protein